MTDAASPCGRHATGGEIIGLACPECGHTNVVHPGYGNPAIDTCLLCRLELQAARGEETK